MRTEANVVGYNKSSVWFRVPKPGAPNAHIILTMPRKKLPRGMANAAKVYIEWDGVVRCDNDDTADIISGFYTDNLEVINATEYKGESTGT